MLRFAAATLVSLIALPAVVLAQSAPTAPPAAAPAAATTTPATKTENPEARARFERFRAACGADLQTHCPNIVRGTEQGRIDMRQCVETHKAKFSTACQAAVAERDANREARKQAQPAATEKPKS